VLKRVAFVCAMPMEIIPLQRKLALERTVHGSLEVYAGSLGGRPVVGIVTGIGRALAAEGIERLIDAIDVKHVVVVGIAGAIADDTPIGALITPALVVRGTDGAEFRPTRFGGGSPTGILWTSDVLITDLEAIARLRAKGVVALDMETAAIAAICQRRNIAWSVFRSISDRATEHSLDDDVFHLINGDGTFNIKKIASFLVTHPGRMPALARLAKGARLAAEHAATAAISAVSQYP
jgi:adenosylhomocysteine nucleosidase